jgi:hypothetical protein
MGIASLHPSHELTEFVMAGLVPAIHVFLTQYEDVDARHRAGHDEDQ